MYVRGPSSRSARAGPYICHEVPRPVGGLTACRAISSAAFRLTAWPLLPPVNRFTAARHSPIVVLFTNGLTFRSTLLAPLDMRRRLDFDSQHLTARLCVASDDLVVRGATAKQVWC